MMVVGIGTIGFWGFATRMRIFFVNLVRRARQHCRKGWLVMDTFHVVLRCNYERLLFRFLLKGYDVRAGGLWRFCE